MSRGGSPAPLADRVLSRPLTAYEARWFRLFVRFPDDYPLKPPEVRFVTKVVHVNVNGEGRICHGAFGTAYTSSATVSELLAAVWQLLAAPEAADPLEKDLAALYYMDKKRQEAGQPSAEYWTAAKKAALQHGAENKAELLAALKLSTEDLEVELEVESVTQDLMAKHALSESAAETVLTVRRPLTPE